MNGFCFGEVFARTAACFRVTEGLLTALAPTA